MSASKLLKNTSTKQLTTPTATIKNIFIIRFPTHTVVKNIPVSVLVLLSLSVFLSLNSRQEHSQTSNRHQSYTNHKNLTKFDRNISVLVREILLHTLWHYYKTAEKKTYFPYVFFFDTFFFSAKATFRKSLFLKGFWTCFDYPNTIQQ